MRIEHIALNVPDPAAMAEWYGRHLGMRIVRRVDGPPHTRFLADDAGRTVLEFYRQDAVPLPDYFQQDPLTLHIAFLSDAIDEDRLRLLAAGAKGTGDIKTTPAGDRMTFLHDPWGVAVQLVTRVEPLV